MGLWQWVALALLATTTGASADANATSGGAAAPVTVSADEALRIALEARDSPRSACAHDTCDGCTADPECGWCESSGRCQAGDTLGPSPGMDVAPCAVWSFGVCAGTACRSLQTCGDCTGDPDCGWCEGSCSCMERHATDPTSPAFGECDEGWFHEAGWAKKTCPMHPASHCLAVHLLNANAEGEAGQPLPGAAEENTADGGGGLLDATLFPQALRISGRLLLRGVAQASIDNTAALNMVRSGIATALGVPLGAVAVPAINAAAGAATGVPPAPGSQSLHPTLMLQVAEERSRKAIGFIRAIGSLVKRALGVKKKTGCS